MARLVPVSERTPDGGPVLETGRPGPGFPETEAEAISRVQPDVMIVLGDQTLEEADWGSVYITNRRVIWLSAPDQAPPKGYAVDFLSLGVHALCRDLESFPRECIYMQIDRSGSGSGDSDEDDADDEVEEQGADRATGDRASGPTAKDGKAGVSHANGGASGAVDLARVEEVRLVPRDPTTLDALFQCLSQNAALNPDPEGEREGEGDWFFDEEEVLGGAAAAAAGPGEAGMTLGEVPTDGHHALPNPELLEFEDDADQFDDADEEDTDMHVN